MQTMHLSGGWLCTPQELSGKHLNYLLHKVLVANAVQRVGLNLGGMIEVLHDRRCNDSAKAQRKPRCTWLLHRTATSIPSESRKAFWLHVHCHHKHKVCVPVG